VGSGREVHGKENPRKHYAVGLRTEPAHLVRGSSRRITIMRFRPANIRVINRRNSRLDRDLRCLLRKDGKKKENKEEEKTKRPIPRGLGDDQAKRKMGLHRQAREDHHRPTIPGGAAIQ